MENLTNRFINICIYEKAMCKLQYYCEYAVGEVGGVLEIDCDKKNLTVKDVIILKQTASWGDFHLDDDALSDYTEKIFLKKPDKLNHIKGWWHKHGITGWSSHDDTTFKELRKYFKGFVFGIVMRDTHKIRKNKFSPLCRLEIGKGDLDDGKTQIIQFHTPHIKVIKKGKNFDKRKLRKKCKKEVGRMVEEERIIVTQNQPEFNRDYVPYQGYQNRDDYERPSYGDRENIGEPATDNSTAKILKKAGLVWDSDLGYYVHKEYYKGKKEPRQTSLTGTKQTETELEDYDDMDKPYYNLKGNFVIIEGKKINLKSEIECTFSNIECNSCPYKGECIIGVKERMSDTEKDYLDYFRQ